MLTNTAKSLVSLTNPKKCNPLQPPLGQPPDDRGSPLLRCLAEHPPGVGSQYEVPARIPACVLLAPPELGPGRQRERLLTVPHGKMHWLGGSGLGDAQMTWVVSCWAFIASVATLRSFPLLQPLMLFLDFSLGWLLCCKSLCYLSMDV